MRQTLATVDAPELKQLYGKEAKKALSDRVFGESVSVQVIGKDRYKRTRGYVLVPARLQANSNGITLEFLSVWLIENGHGWHDRKYVKGNERLAVSERKAREAKRGLWADDMAVPPWKWRKTHDEEDAENPQTKE